MTAAMLSVDVTLAHASAPKLEVAFVVPPGVTVFSGHSGAGKSRTLAAIAGLVRPTRGRVTLGEEIWFDSERRIHLPVHRRRIAYVFQGLALFPHLTALDNVAYGFSRETPRRQRRERALALLERMRVGHLAERFPPTFSGGEAQRVALARALSTEPSVLFLDEPFSALDRAIKEELVGEMKIELARRAVPTILVTHHAEDAATLGERVVRLAEGRVVLGDARSVIPRA